MKKILLLFSFLTIWTVAMAEVRNIPLLQAFDGRYNDLKDTKISLIEQPNNYYYSIKVENNPEVISQILKWEEETEKEASNKVTTIKDGVRRIVLNIYGHGDDIINIGIRYPADQEYVRMFIQSSEPLK